jgi:hypothetical protein
MNALTPGIASELADIVYGVSEPVASGIYDLAFSPQILKSFSFDMSTGRVTGRSGGFLGIFQRTSGFAMVGHGKERYQGHHVIAVRGTKSGHDWLTNGNVGISTAENGSSVHSGFNMTFNSMKPGLERMLNPHLSGPGVKAVHCVGHSLGGALASLTAGWIKQRYGRPVHLYTFGAPRVGLDGSATKATFEIDRIFRSTHGADPVPNVPLWPFVHAPNNGFEYRLDNSSGISVEAHGMSEADVPGYRNTANSADWSALHQTSLGFLNQAVRLDYARRQDATFSGYWADRISAALVTLLKDAGYYTTVLAQAAIGSSLTFYDLLARTIEKVAKASAKLAAQATGLLGHMLVFAGLVGARVVDLSFQFIRWVFQKTSDVLYRAVSQAIKRSDD